MKHLTFFVQFFLLASISLFAQNFRVTLPVGQNKIVITDSRPNLDGSPYLFEDWRNGSIYMNNGDTIVSIMLRYNVYKDEMQFQNEDKIYTIGSPENIARIILDNQTFVYLNYEEEGKPKKGYFEVLSQGTTCLLQRHFPTILAANFNVALNSGNKNDQLSLKKKFYLKKEALVVEIDKKGKNYVSAFDLKGKDIQKFAKDNDLSFKKDEDLIQITKFANSLN